MKAILRDRIFIQVDDNLKTKLIKELSYKIPLRVSMSEVRYVPHYDYRIINTNTMTIPIGRTDLIPITHEIIDKRIYALEDFHISSGITLRPSQQNIYDSVEDNAIINAGCSFGKTFTALSLVEKLGQKTIVIVHTKKLQDQWIEETKNLLGITPGIIGAGKYELDNQICIAVNKTIMSKGDSTLYNMFGTLIVDEVHHIAAKTFNTIVDKFRSRYKIGLSATLRRKDEKNFLITNYITHNNIFKPPLENSLKPKVITIKTNIIIPGDVSWQGRVNKLFENNEYAGLVYELIVQNTKIGHKVLAVSSRLNLIDRLKRLIPNSGIVVGGLDNTKEITAGLKDGTITSLLGSTQIVSEGVSFNPLSALILAQPISSDILLEQLIGRIIRVYPNKMQPLIYDIRLKGITGENQYRIRKAHYKKMGYEITEILL